MTTNNNKNIMDFFPLPTARKSQEIVIREIDKAFESGKRIVVLEAPVGSGKSAIAVTLARAVGALKKDAEGVGGAHVITPRKSLQDQYYEDFGDELVLMKGRNAYPCTNGATATRYKAVIRDITAGKIVQPSRDQVSCAEGPCKDDIEVYKSCTSERDCPYTAALDIALGNDIVVHNLHSFIFQASLGKKFQKRELLIIDEAHEIENTIREFVKKKIAVRVPVDKQELDGLSDIGSYVEFLTQDRFLPAETNEDVELKKQNASYVSKRDEYLSRVRLLEEKNWLADSFSVEFTPMYKTVGSTEEVGFILEFTPHNIGSAANNMLFALGTKVLLMSGTFYSKELVCKNLGLSITETQFIRTSSSFPVENRPIYLKPEFQVNTSFATWDDNFKDLITIIQKIMGIFCDARGLIHAPSYFAAEQIRAALLSDRIMTHEPYNFSTVLNEFYSTKEPKVLISPVCQQGVDFKGDRARFQIVVRVPYPSTSSQFVKDKLEKDFPWYNHQALVTLGQQLGRVNRSEDDYGATFLVDERFNQFLAKNSKMMPNWVKEAYVWK